MPEPRRGQLPAANRIFVDRELPQKTFEDAAHAIPADRSIVRVFYGVGGQGKTALCRELLRKTDAAFDPHYTFLRRAHVDLHDRSKSDPEQLLIWIRNGFATAGIALPCFDVALALTWEATRGDEPFPRLTKPWLGRTSDVARAGVDAVGGVVAAFPGGGHIFSRIGHWMIDQGKRRWLEMTRTHINELYRDGELKPSHELAGLLPWMLAQDLNRHLADNPDERFVLFVDEYERVFAEGGAGASAGESSFDTHLRTLISETNGLLAVVFSRERLPWADRDPAWRADLEGSQHLLGGLGETDADAFLKAVPIASDEIRKAIIGGARETSEPDSPVYPLMLDLQVEHWRALSASGGAVNPEQFAVTQATFEGRRSEIVGRLLRDYGAPMQATLERLSVARRFDRAAFTHIVTTFNTGLPADQYDVIAKLSFVTADEQGFLSLHNAIAETIRQSLNEDRRVSALRALVEHFVRRAAAEDETWGGYAADAYDAVEEAAHLRRQLGPAGYASWLVAVADPFRVLGEYPALQRLWRDALALCRTASPPEPLEVADCLSQLGGITFNLHRDRTAIAMLEECLALNVEHRGANHAQTASARAALGVAYDVLGDVAAARVHLEQAVKDGTAPDGTLSLAAAEALTFLAGSMGNSGAPEGVIAMHRRAIAALEANPKADHEVVTKALRYLATFLARDGDDAAVEEAIELEWRALRLTRKAVGNLQTVTLGHIIRDLADFYIMVDQTSEVDELLVRSHGIFEHCYGPQHPTTLEAAEAITVYRETGTTPTVTFEDDPSPDVP